MCTGFSKVNYAQTTLFHKSGRNLFTQYTSNTKYGDTKYFIIKTATVIYETSMCYNTQHFASPLQKLVSDSDIDNRRNALSQNEIVTAVNEHDWRQRLHDISHRSYTLGIACSTKASSYNHLVFIQSPAKVNTRMWAND